MASWITFSFNIPLSFGETSSFICSLLEPRNIPATIIIVMMANIIESLLHKQMVLSFLCVLTRSILQQLYGIGTIITPILSWEKCGTCQKPHNWYVVKHCSQAPGIGGVNLDERSLGQLLLFSHIHFSTHVSLHNVKYKHGTLPKTANSGSMSWDFLKREI